MESTYGELQLIEFRKSRHTTIYWIQNHPHIALVVANASYIPIQNFKETFESLEELIRDRKITKLVFDKRNMKVFHQPSMEWYFVEWKEKMADLGLDHHVKILPEDNVFRQSVKLGRQQINQKFPGARFHQLKIEYAPSLEVAVDL